MKTGWIAQSGKFYPAEITEHDIVAQTLMQRQDFPAIRLCGNGYALFDGSKDDMTQAQIDSLFDWTQTEPNAESWEVIADFLGIEQS